MDLHMQSNALLACSPPVFFFLHALAPYTHSSLWAADYVAHRVANRAQLELVTLVPT